LLGQYHDLLESLKLVEYVGEDKDSTYYQLNEVNVKLQLYQIYDADQAFQEQTDIPQAQITNMPHIRFDGQWDEYAESSFSHQTRNILLTELPDLSSKTTSKETSYG
jgi:hypothetical protein